MAQEHVLSLARQLTAMMYSRFRRDLDRKGQVIVSKQMVQDERQLRDRVRELARERDELKGQIEKLEEYMRPYAAGEPS